jgi:hypothetical protein
MKIATITLFTNGNQIATTTMSTPDDDISDTDFVDNITKHLANSTLTLAALNAANWNSLIVSIDGTNFERNR